MMVSETSLDYERITLPYITQSQFSTQVSRFWGMGKGWKGGYTVCARVYNIDGWGIYKKYTGICGVYRLDVP